MKKICLIISTLFVGATLAQAPAIEGTYFPVRNTGIKQVWDVTPGSVAIPQTGPNKTWDYRFTNGQFGNITDTFPSRFLDPSATPYAQYHPQANQSTFIRTPLNNFSDSLYYYYKVTPDGTYITGGFNIGKDYDSTIINTKYEFFMPYTFNYGDNYKDTSFYTVYAKKYPVGPNFYPVKLKGKKIKTLEYVGYGTLKLPNGTYNNVAQIKEVFSASDSIFVDLASNGNYTFAYVSPRAAVNYYFFRNNTFGSAYLAYFSANPANTQVQWAWYTLPVDFGSITGTVYTNTLETTPVTNGEVYLYRENSNFKKNDILARAPLNASGVYKFDSIPYGEYRFAVRSNTLSYPNSMITYLGDKTDWLQATTIITTTSTPLSSGHKIHLQYHAAPSGSNNITGQLVSNPYIMRSANSAASKPVPSIGIVVKKNPGSTAARTIVTDSQGGFDLGTTLEDGSYTLFVDIPGLHMAGTYSFTVSGGQAVNGLDFTAGTDSIHPYATAVIGVKEITKIANNLVMSVYPNPYNTNTTIEVKVVNASNVLLEVYNMLGEKVQILDNSLKQAGNYKYNFSAKNLNYGAGIYFVKLSVGNQNKVIKVIEQ